MSTEKHNQQLTIGINQQLSTEYPLSETLCYVLAGRLEHSPTSKRPSI